ncbi:uncharacterized protein LOC131941546 [Physella acuta]|uniref:uncharacterized protein LOC131941546 n=1 Tax=Physella acuta TaxID=109671 RepID=UPI0027DBF514|nr:uncharacterized protein LOC131941546 [Physella acuta]
MPVMSKKCQLGALVLVILVLTIRLCSNNWVINVIGYNSQKEIKAFQLSQAVKQNNQINTQTPIKFTAPPTTTHEVKPPVTRTRPFTRVPGEDTYIYSAIANIEYEEKKKQLEAKNITSFDLELILTTLDATRHGYNCCVIYHDPESVTLTVTPASHYFREFIVGGPSNEKLYAARQYVCHGTVSTANNMPEYVTLTSSSKCPTHTKDYLKVLYPIKQPGIALCGKIAHSGGVEPQKAIEWFEMQKLLGVDKILIYDLGNPEGLTRVFRHYQQEGILDLQPYELPGEPESRSLTEAYKHTAQFNYDETLAVLECRHRMAGYDYVISHDMDEMIIPRQAVDLKTFFQEKWSQRPTASALFFHTEFFLTTWEPSNPEEQLMVKRFRNTTVPRWECYKYVYKPSRVITSITHTVFSRSAFKTINIEPNEAILHHYRKCPEDTWKTCSVPSKIDDVMTRYKDLDPRVVKVREVTATPPLYKPRQ